jgi:N-acetylneuraminate synthase
MESQDFINGFSVPFNKIASAMNTNLDFVEKVAKELKVTFLSTGMSEMEDIEKCVAIFEKYKCPLILMHTVSTYPANDADLNLAVIGSLKARFGVPIGYSGHESSVSPSIVAASLGAVVIERHVTLDRTMWGTDQSASLEADGIKQLSGVLKRIPIVIGRPDKNFIESEKKAAANLRYW